MGGTGELPSVKPRLRRGLRKLSPDLISKARDETATQVTRVGLTLLGATVFFLLSVLITPDSALLGGTERINVPLAGPLSFSWFMLVGPTILIGLWLYLQIYVNHSDRLDRVARLVSVVRAPTLVPLQNLLIWFLNFVLLPTVIMMFAMKAAVFPSWGAGLFGVAVGFFASNMLLAGRRSMRQRDWWPWMAMRSRPPGAIRRWFQRWVSWRSNALVSISAAILVGGLFFGFRLQRPFFLLRANLSGYLLHNENLRKAELWFANLRDAQLLDVNLSDAKLVFTNLNGAVLQSVNLSGATLLGANLSGATVWSTNFSGADLKLAILNDADLAGALDLTQSQLDQACGSNAKLPGGLTLNECSTDRLRIAK